MKLRSSILSVLLIIFTTALFSCEDKSEFQNMSVDRYVSLLKAGKYDESELPNFNAIDIEKLLTYRNETQEISNFPRNPISSSFNEEVTLGMYILWTIESIRARSYGSEFLNGSFPSQNPVIINKDNIDFTMEVDPIQKIVADSYYNWWETNKSKDFSEFDEIDPLEETVYRWH